MIDIKKLAAAAVAGVALSGAATAQATPFDRDLRAPTLAQVPPSYRECPGKWVCLWQDQNAAGRRIQYFDYGTFKLANKSMGAGKRGVTSYYNHQCCGATATLIGPGFRFPLNTYGNVPAKYNDKATYVRLER